MITAPASGSLNYEEHGGTEVSARELNVAEQAVIKTSIFEDENAKLFAESVKP